MSLTKDRTNNKNDEDLSEGFVDMVQRAVVGDHTELDCHLVQSGILAGNGPGPETLFGRRFTWVL